MKTLQMRVRLGNSPIDHKGLFATQEIERGNHILQYIGEKISKAEDQRRFAQGNDDIFARNDR